MGGLEVETVTGARWGMGFHSISSPIPRFAPADPTFTFVMTANSTKRIMQRSGLDMNDLAATLEFKRLRRLPVASLEEPRATVRLQPS